MSELSFTFTRFRSLMTVARTHLSLTAALVLFIQVFKAQVTITVPSGNTNSTGLTHAEWRKPFGTYFGYERSAFIYSHAEIGQYGTIDALSFFCDTLNNPGAIPVKIYLKETPDSIFSGITSVAAELTGGMLVYDDTLSASAFTDSSWITLNLPTPFLHASANSIEVIVETNAGGSGNEGSLGKGFYHYTTSAYAFQYWSADNTPPAGPGTLSYKRPNIRFTMTPATACGGAPNAGIAAASVDSTCSEVDLYLTGSENATGLSYQWEDSLAGGSWTSIANATAIMLSTSIADTTWFRCKVSCGANSSYSAIKQVFKRDYLNCYCTAGLGGGCTSTYIDSVAIASTSLANGSTGCSPGNYTQYPAAPGTSAQLAPATSYSLHTRFAAAVIASVWIDYDQSGIMDSSEWSLICSSCMADSDYVTTLAVPANAKNGLSLMRIRTRASGNSNTYYDACTTFGSGETEDYFIGVNYPVAIASPSGVPREFRLYPNPASEKVLLAGDFSSGEALTISVYTMEGALVLEHSARYGGYLHLDVAGLQSGAYFVKVSGALAYAVKKLIIAR